MPNNTEPAPIAQHILEIARARRWAMKYNEANRKVYTDAARQLSPLAFMQQFVFQKFTCPRGTGKTEALAMIATYDCHYPVAFFPQGSDFMSRLRQKEAQLGMPPRHGDCLLASPHAALNNLLDELGGNESIQEVLVDEWSLLNAADQERLLMHFAPLAAKDPEFLFIATDTGK